MIDDDQKISLKCNYQLPSLKYHGYIVAVFKDEKSVFDVYELYKDDLERLVNGLVSLAKGP